MADAKAEQNKQILIIIVMVVVLGGFLFFKMSKTSKGPATQGEDLSTIPKAQDLERMDVPYKKDDLKDPFKFSREMFKDPSESGASSSDWPEEEEVQVKKAVELPPMSIKGVIVSDRPSVIVDNKVLKKGETIYDAQIMEISREKVVFQYMGELFDLPTPIMTTQGYDSISQLPERDVDASLDTEVVQTVNINGTILFEKYKEGNIVLIARMPEGKDVKVTLPKPGSFTLSVPVESGEVFLSAINMQENKTLAKLPFGAYAKNPIEVQTGNIEDIEIVIEEVK